MSIFFLFKHTAPTEIYTLSLHDALPISLDEVSLEVLARLKMLQQASVSASIPEVEQTSHQQDRAGRGCCSARSEEHTSELQSHSDLVCRLLLEKKKRFRSPHCASSQSQT